MPTVTATGAAVRATPAVDASTPRDAQFPASAVTSSRLAACADGFRSEAGDVRSLELTNFHRSGIVPPAAGRPSWGAFDEVDRSAPTNCARRTPRTSGPGSAGCTLAVAEPRTRTRDGPPGRAQRAGPRGGNSACSPSAGFAWTRVPSAVAMKPRGSAWSTGWRAHVASTSPALSGNYAFDARAPHRRALRRGSPSISSIYAHRGTVSIRSSAGRRRHVRSPSEGNVPHALAQGIQSVYHGSREAGRPPKG